MLTLIESTSIVVLHIYIYNSHSKKNFLSNNKLLKTVPNLIAEAENWKLASNQDNSNKECCWILAHNQTASSPMTSDGLELHKAELEINNPNFVFQLLVLLHTETEHSNQLLLVPLISAFLFHLISQTGQIPHCLHWMGKQIQVFFSS